MDDVVIDLAFERPFSSHLFYAGVNINSYRAWAMMVVASEFAAMLYNSTLFMRNTNLHHIHMSVLSGASLLCYIPLGRHESTPARCYMGCICYSRRFFNEGPRKLHSLIIPHSVE